MKMFTRIAVLAAFIFAAINVQAADYELTVGSDGDYPTLGHVFSDINAGMYQDGDVQITIISDVTEEAPAELLDWDNGYDLLITTKDDYTVSGDFDDILVWIEDTENVTIDGMDGDLTFENESDSFSMVVIGGSDFTLKGCNLIASSNDEGVGLNIAEVDDFLISGNHFYRVDLGIAGVDLYSGTITGNKFGSATKADMIQSIAINIFPDANDVGIKDFEISNNEVLGMYREEEGLSHSGIRVVGGVDGFITGNKIHNMYNAYSGAYALRIEGAEEDHELNTIIANNMIYDIAASDLSGADNFPVGCIISSVADTYFYNNTINLYYDGNGLDPVITANFFVAGYTSDIYFKNNIVQNTYDGQIGAYGFYMNFGDDTYANIFTETDYNNYYIASTGDNFYGYANADIDDFDDWSTEVDGEDNSTTKEADFVANDNPYLDGPSFYDVSFFGTSLKDVVYDIDGEMRRTKNPNKGADEVIPEIIFNKSMMIADGGSEGEIQCNDSKLTFVCQAEMNEEGFGDGVERQVPDEPAPNLSYTWYQDGNEIEEDDNTTFNGDTELTTTLDYTPEYNFQHDAVFSCDVVWQDVKTSSSLTFPVEQQLEFTNNLPVASYVCEGSNAQELTVGVVGTLLFDDGNGNGNGGSFNKDNDSPLADGYSNFTWWFSKDEEGPFEEIIEDNPYYENVNTNNITIFFEDAEAVKGYYKMTAYGPGNCGESELETDVSYFDVSQLLTNVHMDVPMTPGNICQGDEVYLTANAEGTIMGYEWQYSPDGENWEPIDPADNNTATNMEFALMNAQPNQSGWYRAVIIGTSACYPQGDYPVTIPVKLTVWPQFNIVAHPESHVICEGQDIELEIVVDGIVFDDKDYGIYAYQWLKDGKPIDIKKNPTAKEALLVVENADYNQSAAYSCIIKVQDCLVPLDAIYREVETKAANVYVLSEPEITKQPGTVEAEEGGIAKFEVEAHVRGIVPPYYEHQYQWYRYDFNNFRYEPLEDNDKFAGTNTSILTINGVEADDYNDLGLPDDNYIVIVTGMCGEVTSEPSYLVPMPDVSIETIADFEVCASDDIVIDATVTTDGSVSNVNYQWFFNDQPLVDDGTKITGATTETLTIMNAEIGVDDAATYYLVAIPEPNGDPATSNEVTVTINTAPVFSTDLDAAATVETGKDVTFEVDAADADSYQWYVDGTPVAGAETETFTLSDLDASQDGTIVYVEAINACGTTKSTELTLSVQKKTTDITGIDGLGIVLYEASPNPSNGESTIKFELPSEMRVKVVLRDMTGRELKIIYDGIGHAGINNIDMHDFGLNLTSGMYFYTMTANGFNATKQILIVK